MAEIPTIDQVRQMLNPILGKIRAFGERVEALLDGSTTTLHKHTAQETLGMFYGTSIAGSATVYGTIWKAVLDGTPNNISVLYDGTIKDFSIRVNGSTGAQPGDGSLDATLYVNNVATSLTVSVPAGTSSATTITDTTHSVAVSAGDNIHWVVVNNSASQAMNITSISAILESDTL